MMKSHKIRDSVTDRIFNVFLTIICAGALLIAFYPLYFVLMASMSDPQYVNSGRFLLYPAGFTLEGYQQVLADERVWIGYVNSIIYALGGILYGLVTAVPLGYALSRKELPCRKFLTGLFIFTMYFQGGMVPLYLTVKELGLIDTRLIIIILGSFAMYNVIIVRSYFASSLPEELREASLIDGCGDLRYFVKIALPLAKPIIAVVTLYILIAKWNEFTNAMIYLNKRKLYPLQLYLRELLLTFSSMAGSATGAMAADAETLERYHKLSQIIRYGFIVIASLPLLIAYPFVQKYFVQGVMIGSLKG
ncbi:MAG: carbohydrate ABC transporter permease [Clostridiales bacterium]|mgnify:CR=1 FL=1|nr:carbohydrate ABC transporter permease [Clostridiales bacterium]